VRNHDKGNIAVREMDVDAIEIVGPERTVRTARFPRRIEHEVVNRKLAAACEQLGELLPASGAVKFIVFRDSLPGQFAPLARQPVAEPRVLLFFV
jgi:hypothetical protein